MFPVHDYEFTILCFKLNSFGNELKMCAALSCKVTFSKGMVECQLFVPRASKLVCADYAITTCIVIQASNGIIQCLVRQF